MCGSEAGELLLGSAPRFWQKKKNKGKIQITWPGMHQTSQDVLSAGLAIFINKWAA